MESPDAAPTLCAISTAPNSSTRFFQGIVRQADERCGFCFSAAVLSLRHYQNSEEKRRETISESALFLFGPRLFQQLADFLFILKAQKVAHAVAFDCARVGVGAFA